MFSVCLILLYSGAEVLIGWRHHRRWADKKRPLRKGWVNEEPTCRVQYMCSMNEWNNNYYALRIHILHWKAYRGCGGVVKSGKSKPTTFTIKTKHHHFNHFLLDDILMGTKTELTNQRKRRKSPSARRRRTCGIQIKVQKYFMHTLVVVMVVRRKRGMLPTIYARGTSLFLMMIMMFVVNLRSCYMSMFRFVINIV